MTPTPAPKFKIGDKVKTPAEEGAFEIMQIVYNPEENGGWYTYIVRSTATYPFDEMQLEKFHA